MAPCSVCSLRVHTLVRQQREKEALAAMHFIHQRLVFGVLRWRRWMQGQERALACWARQVRLARSSRLPSPSSCCAPPLAFTLCCDANS